MANVAPINTSLLDELDADFAASGSEGEDELRDEEADAQLKNGNSNGEDGDRMQVDGQADSGLLTDQKWQELDAILQKIRDYKANPPKVISNTLSDDPQYKVLAEANNFSTRIVDYTQEYLKRIRDYYQGRFPELETLLPDPLEYTKAVAAIGNGPFDSDTIQKLSNNKDNLMRQPLTSILSRPKIMTVTVEATSTRGIPLPEDQIKITLDTCAKMLRLEQARFAIEDFVETRMNTFCPNLTILLGSATAAQLVTARGGLEGLCASSASNLPSIGNKRHAASGLATNVGVRNQGFLYDSEPIKYVRPDNKTKAMRKLAGKLLLAARADSAREFPDGSYGRDLLDMMEKAFDKLSDAAPNTGNRALPIPISQPSKKRGGRRARAAKQATATTDLAKARNRMAFGKEEAEVGYGTGDSTAGMGMVGATGDGRVRATQLDTRTRAKLSKRNAGWGAPPTGSGGNAAAGGARGAGNAGAHGLRTGGVATSAQSAVGTASSLQFGLHQGLELVDPRHRAELAREKSADADRWFKGGAFTQVKSSIKSGAETGEFKKPALPGAGTKRKAVD